MVKPLALALAAAIGAAACASRSGVPQPRPFPGASLPPAAAEPAPAAPGDPAETSVAPAAAALIETALGLRGTPYRNGGSDLLGFDCSGFVQYVFAQHGVRLPREVRDQYRAGRGVERGDLRPGDLVFFETVGRGASHVGIALGDDQFVHAPSSRGVVRVERITSAYWDRRWVGARRIAHDTGTVE